MRIAVVGSGPSGSTIVRELLTSPLNEGQLNIDVFEEDEKLVVGQAYEADTHEAIMNEHARDLTIDPDEPYDFMYWLEKHYPEWARRDAFVPRSIYGEYLYDRLYQYYQADNVNVIQTKVIDIEFKDGKRHLQGQSGDWFYDYNAVFLAIGHPPYADHYQLIGEDNYINNPFPIKDKLNRLGYGMNVGVIGSGLSSFDIVKYLIKETEINLPLKIFIQDEEPFHTVKFYRYDGELSMTFNDDWIASELKKGKRYIPLDLMVETFLNDLAENDIDFNRLNTLYGNGTLDEVALAIVNQDEDLSKLRRYVVMVTQYLPDLFNALTPSDRDRYTHEYEETFNHFRSQMPNNSLEFILYHLEEGTLEIVSNLQNIYPKEDGSGFDLFTVNDDHHRADILINATGFQYDLSKAINDDLLLKNLYDKDIMTPYYRGGIHVTWPQCELVSNKRGRVGHVYLLGHWISKIHYGNNNIHLCMKQAKRVVNYFVNEVLNHQ